MSPSNQKDLPKRREKSIQKRVCRYCNLVFNGGRALGGHIKIHLRKKKKTDFFSKKTYLKKPSTLKLNNKTSNHQSKQSLPPPPPPPGSGLGRSREVVDLTKYLSGLQWGVRGRGEEIFDLTKYFRGRGWGLKKLRGSNEGNKPAEIPLVRGNAHRIKRTRGVYMCTICNMSLLTFSAVLAHIRRPNESSESDTTVDMPLLRGEQVGEVQSAAQGSVVVEDKQDVIEQLSNLIDQDQATIDEGGEGGKELEVQSSTKVSMVEKNCEIAQVVDSMEFHNKEPEDQVTMEVDADEIPKSDEMVVGETNASTKVEDNVNQEISTSKPHKMLDFDLNDFPPMED